MENKKDKVDVIISQERYNELLEKENKYHKLVDSNSILLGYKYLDLRSAKSTLMSNKDAISIEYHVGDNVPKEFLSYLEETKSKITEKIEFANERRLEKIEGAKLYLAEQIEERYEMGFSPDWTLLEWLGIQWNKLRGKK